MTKEKLKIELRKHQLESDGVPVIVVCNDVGRAEYVPGIISPNEFIDVTNFTLGAEKMTLSWDAINSGTSEESTQTNEVGSNYDKGISLELTFNDIAYQFIYSWLLQDRCGILNSIEIRITDLMCGKKYRLFEIKADNLTFAPIDAPCEFTVRLREADPVWHCIHKTFIFDNWQNWFIDGSIKKHPCFLTCIDPNNSLLVSARMGISILGHTIPIFSSIFNENENYARRILSADNFSDAPLIRDYISNVCDKCGIAYDTIFHDPTSPYFNLCLYFPASGYFHVNSNSNVATDDTSFHFENRWNITLAELLDKLKNVFNAEWYVTPQNILIFKNKEFFLNAEPIYDFTLPGAQPIWELVYTFNGEKKPAYGRYEYSIDAGDFASQQIEAMYNDIVDYDGSANNPMLEGNLDKRLEWSSTGFIRDGKAKDDYLVDVISEGETVAYAILILLAVVTTALVVGVLSAGAGALLGLFVEGWAISIAILANNLRDSFQTNAYTGAVRTTSVKTSEPRLLLWDGVSFERAKVVSKPFENIIINEQYNTDQRAYGDFVSFRYIINKAYNYDMYFESFFFDNLYDRFHDSLDNPLNSLDTHQEFSFFTDLCCEFQTLIGVWEDSFAKIGFLIKIEHRDTYDLLGRINHFEINEEEQIITLKGVVLRKKR